MALARTGSYFSLTARDTAGDGANQDLKVAHCANRLYVPYHRPR